jgi:hypothetical protein
VAAAGVFGTDSAVSDYLGHLIERTIVPTTGVRPRIPSFFEPPPVSGMREEPAELEDSARAQTSPRAPTTKTSSAFSAMIEPETPAAPQPNGRRPNSETGSAPPTAIKRNVEVPASANSKEEAASASETNSDQAPSQRPSSKMPNVPADIHPVVRAKPAAEKTVSPNPPPLIPPLGRIESRSQPAADPTAVSPKLKPTDISKEKTTTAPVAGPRERNFDSSTSKIAIRPLRPARGENSFSAVVFNRRDAARLAANPVPPALPPTIQITIGRLEVRAVAAAAASPRLKTKKEPAMSLETYLQRRAGEGRR